MKSIILFFSIISLTLFIYINEEIYAQKTAKEIYDENNSSVIYLEVYDKYLNATSFGSGFLVSSDGFIVTNYHVINDAFAVKAYFSTGRSEDVKMIYNFDKEFDLALLKIYGSYYDYVSVGSSESMNIGEEVYAIGSPQGFVNTISNGIISNIIFDKDDYFFQITAPISPGSSGGALFDKYGYLVGVTCATFEGGQNLNYAIPSKYVNNLIYGTYLPMTFKEFQEKFNKKKIVTEQPRKKKEETYPNYERTRYKKKDYKGPINTSFLFGAYYLVSSLEITNEIPSEISGKNGFSITFSYLFSENWSVKLNYQTNYFEYLKHNYVINNIRADLIVRTSNSDFRGIFGIFGLGLASSELVYNTYLDSLEYEYYTGDFEKVTIGKTKNFPVITFSAGVEYKFFKRFGLEFNVPFDIIILNDQDVFVIASPMLGLSVGF